MLVTKFCAIILLSSITKAFAEKYKAFPEVIEKCKDTAQDYIDFGSVKLNYGKDGSVGIIGAIVCKEDIPLSSTVLYKIYKKSKSGTWNQVPFPLPEMNICSYVLVDKFIYSSVTQYTNMPKTCPFNKDVWRINGTNWNLGDIPPIIATPGCFRVVVQVKNHGEIIACAIVIAKVTQPNGSRLPRCS